MKHHATDFERHMKLMRRSNGEVAEDGFGWMMAHAQMYLPQLIAAFDDPHNEVSRNWLIELIAAAKSEAATPFLIGRLHDPDESIRRWAAQGLRTLDTKESRRALWERGAAIAAPGVRAQEAGACDSR